jgi:tetratricopeptide (TPR) repeat protein
MENHLALWQPVTSSLLGLALVLLGSGDEVLHLLEEGVTQTRELGVNAYLALWTSHLAEGLLAAGQTERALATAQEALDLAVAHKERGHQAWVFRLLAEVFSHPRSFRFEQAEAHYRQAIELASDLGMRPLLGISHLGLGQMYRRAGERSRAEEHLTSALSLCLDMNMGSWLERSAMEMKGLGNLFVVSAENPTIYDFLTQVFTGSSSVHIIRDRRRLERREAAQPGEPAWRGQERRRQPNLVERLRSRGVVVIPEETAGSLAA